MHKNPGMPFQIYEELEMCGRYYIDSDMAEEIETVVRYVDQRIRKKQFSGDIRPTEFAPVIEKSERGLKLDVCKWGYPLAKGNNLVINARTESVMDKIVFQNGILYHRILIPASGFYEWNRLKEKNTFTRPDAPVLYMAGFCDWFENEVSMPRATCAEKKSRKQFSQNPVLWLGREMMAVADLQRLHIMMRRTPGQGAVARCGLDGPA